MNFEILLIPINGYRRTVHLRDLPPEYYEPIMEPISLDVHSAYPDKATKPKVRTFVKTMYKSDGGLPIYIERAGQ